MLGYGLPVRAAGQIDFNDRLEEEKIDFHQRVRDSYCSIARKDPQRVKMLDAALPVDELFEQVKKQVLDALQRV